MPDRRWGGCIPHPPPWIRHCTRGGVVYDVKHFVISLTTHSRCSVRPNRCSFYSKVLCLKNRPPPYYILNNSAKNEPILIIFGVQNHD